MPQAVFLTTATAVFALLLLDLLALWMQRRRWIHWRRAAPSPTGGGCWSGLLTGFQQLVEPQVRHVIEDRDERRLGRAGIPAGGGDDR